ncbi:hypothetical protein ADS79_03220 [Brevibacillus reuszeri]|nr:hypothetical protein ADS79_03220 [Brevibacillus reuszeri]
MNKGFPEGLLSKSIEERVDYFNKYTVSHPILREVFDQLLKAIRNSQRSIILVYGPSGVGKSTLYTRMLKKLTEDALPLIEKDPGMIPVVGHEAISPDSGNFDWKDFFVRTLELLMEPLIDHKVEFRRSPHVKEDKTRTMRNALEKTLLYRKPSAFLIDEAQHLTKMTSSRKLRNQMDTIKSLASKSKVPHVLIGTYELLPFRNLSGQLTRRGSDIHFPRYRAEESHEVQSFINVLWTFQRQMPIENQPDLINNWEFFYKRSIGCIGILKDWLSLTLQIRLEEGAKTITMDDFQKYAHSIEQCLKMAREAREGEAQLEENQEKISDLDRILGIGQVDNSDNSESERKYKNKRAASIVGQRNPKRDKVGEGV